MQFTSRAMDWMTSGGQVPTDNHEDWLTRASSYIFLENQVPSWLTGFPSDWIIALLIAATAFGLAVRRSTWIVDFTVFRLCLQSRSAAAH